MKKFVYSLALLVSVFAVSCGDDDTGEATPNPVSNFTFEIDGKTATFTDASSDGATYIWDFGDGNSSSEASPVHTYAGNGSYVAKLTVSNAAGEDDKQSVLEIINVSIDGNFDDWDDVDEAEFAVSGTLTRLKFENLNNNKLFIYVEGTDALSSLTQIFLNLDNDRATGAGIDWLYFQGGEDYLVEGTVAAGEDQAAAIFGCMPCDGTNPGNWNWGDPLVADVASFLEASEIVSIPGGAAYELSIDLTAFGSTINEEAIGIGVQDIDVASWSAVGAAPALYNETDNPEGSLYIFTFN